MRFDTYQGVLDISFLRLARSDALMKSYDPFVRDSIEKDLRSVGFDNPARVYAVYYDGGSNHSCGGGAWPPHVRGLVAALYLRGTPPGSVPCSQAQFAASPDAPPGYLEFGMLHEIMHTLGFVDSVAPHQTMSGHVSDSPTDLMYAGYESWSPSTLDFGADDYFAPQLPQPLLNFFLSPLLGPSIGAATRAVRPIPASFKASVLCPARDGGFCLEAPEALRPVPNRFLPPP